MALGTFSFREVFSRPLRLIFTFASIAIGVGAVVAVLLAVTTTRKAQRQMLQAVSGKADLELVSNSPLGFDYGVIQQVRENGDVAAAAPLLQALAVMFTEDDRKVSLQVYGMDPRVDPEVRDYTIDGEAPTSLSQVLLSASLAESMGIEVGSTVKLLGRGGLKPFTVSGLVRPNASGMITLGSSVLMVLPAAQRLMSRDSRIDQVQVVLNEGVDLSQAQSALEASLPEGVSLRQPQQRNKVAEETVYGTENALYMAIAFAMLIAVFIIYNTFQMAVGERRRQLGVLRAIGATRKQISRMIMCEALVISLVASVVGCCLGTWGAGILNQATESLLQVQLPAPQLMFWPFLIAVPVGVCVSLLGAFVPAREASHVQPVEAMRSSATATSLHGVLVAKRFGLSLLPIGLLILYPAVTNRLFLGADIVAVVTLMLGLILLLPAVLDPLTQSLLQFVVRPLGVEAKLARNQILRHRGRTTLTIGVLFLAIATSLGMAGNILDNVDNVKGWYSRAIVGDFFIRASMPELATGKSADVPDEVKRELQQVQGIQSIDSLRFASVQSEQEAVLLVVRDFVGKEDAFFDLTSGNAKEALAGLKQGKTVLGSVLAQRRGLSVGDTIAVESPDGIQQVEVVGIANEYFGGGLTFYLDRAIASQAFGVEGVDAFIVTAEDGRVEGVAESLSKVASANGLLLQSNMQLKGYIDGITNGVIASLWMLMTLGCVIAAMGLINTLTMNILEQTREIGMLRTIAMTRSQVRRMIVAQAVYLGLIGLLPGALAGVGIAYVVSLSSLEVLGHTIEFQFRPLLILGGVLVGAVVVLLASLVPAERAARLELSAALHYE